MIDVNKKIGEGQRDKEDARRAPKKRIILM